MSPELISVLGHYIWKCLTVLTTIIPVYLGYKLFILGVKGEASIVVNADSIKGRLTNASPGLFFGLGGVIALIIMIVKGGSVSSAGPNHLEALEIKPSSISPLPEQEVQRHLQIRSKNPSIIMREK